jgi:hypothetical protein
MTLGLRRLVAALFLLSVPFTAQAFVGGPTTIAVTPANAKPGDPVTIVISGRADGCLPQNPVPTIVGRTITITVSEHVACGACQSLDQPYNIQVRLTLPSTAGIYDVNYVAVDTCTAASRVVATQQFVFATGCDFGHSLVATPSSARVGDDITLSWCDPGYSSVDAGYYVDSYTIFNSQSQAGPFTKVMDVDGDDNTHATVKATTTGNNYYYVVSHGCQGAIPLCANGILGDTPMVSNVTAVGIGGTDLNTCLPGPAKLCLLNGRFEATAQFRVAGATVPTPAHAVPLTDQSGYFWFFGPDNVEVTLKTLNACPSSYWVFASGMTNVGVDITVIDTRDRSHPRTYSNAIGTPFAPIQDINAFSCP